MTCLYFCLVFTYSDFLKYQRLVMTQDEIDVLTSFQHGVVLLQMRQADATLRLIRLQVVV